MPLKVDRVLRTWKACARPYTVIYIGRSKPLTLAEVSQIFNTTLPRTLCQMFNISLTHPTFLKILNDLESTPCPRTKHNASRWAQNWPG